MGEMKWYVLRTAGGKEKKAAEYLQKEIERKYIIFLKITAMMNCLHIIKKDIL